jgi:hypothetical protein
MGGLTAREVCFHGGKGSGNDSMRLHHYLVLAVVCGLMGLGALLSTGEKSQGHTSHSPATQPTEH